MRQGDHAGAPLLDRFQVAGVVASWWNEIQYDLKTLAAQGFYGLTDDLLAGRVWVVWTTNGAKGTKHAKARHLS